MRRYYFLIFHNGEAQTDQVGELFGSAELGYGRSRGWRQRHRDRAARADRGAHWVGGKILPEPVEDWAAWRRQLRGARKRWRRGFEKFA